MPDLKPCPFCGGKADTFHIPENTEEELASHPRWRWNYPGMWAIGCDTTLCIGNRDSASILFMTEEQAAKSWNRRANKEAQEITEYISKKEAVTRIGDLLIFQLKGKRQPTWNEVYHAIND